MMLVVNHFYFLISRLADPESNEEVWNQKLPSGTPSDNQSSGRLTRQSNIGLVFLRQT